MHYVSRRAHCLSLSLSVRNIAIWHKLHSATGRWGEAIMFIVFWVVASRVMQTAARVSAELAVSVFRTEERKLSKFR